MRLIILIAIWFFLFPCVGYPKDCLVENVYLITNGHPTGLMIPAVCVNYSKFDQAWLSDLDGHMQKFPVDKWSLYANKHWLVIGPDGKINYIPTGQD